MGSFPPFIKQKTASAIGVHIREKRQDCNPLLRKDGLDKSTRKYYIHNIEYDYRGIDMDELTSLARDFKALGHPARLAILGALRSGEQCVCHLESTLDMRQAYISQQLAVLKEAGLVQDRRDGWNMYYAVTRSEIYTVIDAARAMPGARGKLPARRAVRSGRCSCPKCQPGADRAPIVERAPISEER
jgi:ArsR family transcriptional regulator